MLLHHVSLCHDQTRLQTMPKPLPGQPPLYRGTFHCLYSTLQKEGVRGAYRGLLSPLIGVTPVYCLYFLGYSTGKKMQMKNNDDILKCVRVCEVSAYVCACV